MYNWHFQICFNKFIRSHLHSLTYIKIQLLPDQVIIIGYSMYLASDKRVVVSGQVTSKHTIDNSRSTWYIYFRFRILRKWPPRRWKLWTLQRKSRMCAPFASNLSRLQGICRVFIRFVIIVCRRTFCPRVNPRRAQWVSHVHFVDNLFLRPRLSECQRNGRNSFLSTQ